VGERLTALPGTKAYNHLSIAIQYWYQTAMAVSVKPKSFYPAPKVDSVVVEFIPRSEPLCPVDDLDVFSRFIRMAFSQKRKTIRNALVNAQLGDAAFVDSLLQEAEIDPSHRAETISVERFGNLANVYHRRTRKS
ncbi:MAG: hypothetical protein K2X66_14640, partial [Cyanobacteria bacterium]|nr:hypothetical protein [Cyanobacteriota bacterium]